MKDIQSNVVHLKYPEDKALQMHLGKQKYDVVAKKARTKALPPVVYWKLFVAKRDSDGNII